MSSYKSQKMASFTDGRDPFRYAYPPPPQPQPPPHSQPLSIIIKCPPYQQYSPYPPYPPHQPLPPGLSPYAASYPSSCLQPINPHVPSNIDLKSDVSKVQAAMPCTHGFVMSQISDKKAEQTNGPQPSPRAISAKPQNCAPLSFDPELSDKSQLDHNTVVKVVDSSAAADVPLRFNQADPNFDGLRTHLQSGKHLPTLTKHRKDVIARQANNFVLSKEKLMHRRGQEWFHYTQRNQDRIALLEKMHV